MTSIRGPATVAPEVPHMTTADAVWKTTSRTFVPFFLRHRAQ
jgi:hypothetical protein